VSDDEGRNRLAAIGHPKRLRILRRIGVGRVSPSEIAHEWNEPGTSNISYHARALVELGTIELVDTEPVRGATKHYYEVTDSGKAALEAAAILGLRDDDDGPSHMIPLPPRR
jgi:hypothetical protein